MSARDNAAALEKALKLAALGMYVFPVANKRPTVPRGYNGDPRGGFYHGSTDPEAVRLMWQLHPGSEVGVWAGPSGVVCCDVDPPAAHAEWWNPDTGLGLEMPETFNYPSNRAGGRHYLYKSPNPAPGPKNSIVPHVDRKSGNSLFVWRGDVPFELKLADAPAWLLVGAAASTEPTAEPLSYEAVRERFSSLPVGPSTFEVNTSAAHYGDMMEAVKRVTYLLTFAPDATSGLADKLSEIAENFEGSYVSSVPVEARRAKVVDAACWWLAQWEKSPDGVFFRWAMSLRYQPTVQQQLDQTLTRADYLKVLIEAGEEVRHV